jgi:dethiobiotin synthetase
VLAPLIVVTGTGTGIGKTHLSEALLTRWGRAARVCGLKPIETGVAPGEDGEDGRRLRAASTFHVQHFRTLTFEPPVSPHLAAREAGLTIDVAEIAESVRSIRAVAEGVLVELAGGLFSPLGKGIANVDVARALTPARVVLCAPDRIGVLHDLGATTRAAQSAGLELAGILLSAPDTPDASTGRNASEVPYVTGVPVLATLPRAPAATLANLAELATALASLTV